MSLCNAAMSGSKFSEPYRATKLWLEAVAIFRRGVPLGKNRRQWKTYENCFVAQEAITWFQPQLQIAFDPNISRKQTWMLLQKFYKANIITEVNSVRKNQKNSPTYVNESDFKDNGQLYRLVCTASPYATQKGNNGSMCTPEQSKLATPKKLIQKSNSKCDLVVLPLSADQIDVIWEQIFIEKFTKIVGCDVFTSFFKEGIIKGSIISFNLMQVGPNNITLSTSKEDDLPHWLVSAMKCLANWPSNHTQENEVPNYPGFENDVFKLISDYFTKFQKKGPLLTFDLYDAFITTFIRAELFDFNSRLYSAKISNSSRPRVFQQTARGVTASCMTPHFTSCATQSPMFKMEDQYPFNASESVENLILEILTPSTHGMGSKLYRSKNSTLCQRPIDNFGYSLNPRKKLFNLNPQLNPVPVSNILSEKNTEVRVRAEVCDNSLRSPILDDTLTNSISSVPQPMTVQDYETSRYTQPQPLYYETAFTGKDTPITRVVSHTELKASLGNKSHRSQTKIRPPAASADAVLDGYSTSTYAYENPFLELSGSDLINHPKYSRILQSADLQSSVTASNANAQNSYSLSSNSIWNYSTLESGTTSKTESYAPSSLFDDNFLGRSLRAYSAVNLRDAAQIKGSHIYPCSTLPGSSGFKRGDRDYSPLSPPVGYGKSLAMQYANSPSLMTSEGKYLAVLSFQMLTLLLPPTNRRHLQILLRFMSKTSRNDRLMLDVATSTRAIIINTFFRLILRSEDPTEYDELLALRIVTFMMDNDHDIFAGGIDKDIIVAAEEKISQQQAFKEPITLTKTPLGNKHSGPSKTAKEINMDFKKEDSSVKDSKENSDYCSVRADNKENNGNAQFCSRITMNEYDDQRLLSGTAKSLRDLLDSWCENDSIDDKEKRKQILKFKDEYPHIFWEKFGYKELPSFLKETNIKKKKAGKSWNVFNALRL